MATKGCSLGDVWNLNILHTNNSTSDWKSTLNGGGDCLISVRLEKIRHPASMGLETKFLISRLTQKFSGTSKETSSRPVSSGSPGRSNRNAIEF